MDLVKKKFTWHLFSGLARILFHVLLVALSAGIAFSLPMIVSFIGENFWSAWSLVQNRTIFIISLEIGLAILLLLIFNYVGRSWRDRKLASMAREAGMIHCFPSRRLLAQRKIRRLKATQGFTRDAMIISSTGFRTFADDRGDLHEVLRNCRDTKIMLLNPHSEGARTRANSILDPEVTPERFSEQIKKSIDFLRALKGLKKNIRLKLYGDPPFLKLAVLGEYIWVKHYHPGLDAASMPEYVFEHDQNPGGLYSALYQYFLMRWEDPGIPEYDFETDELVYRDQAGNEKRREKFNDLQRPAGHNRDNHLSSRTDGSSDTGSLYSLSARGVRFCSGLISRVNRIAWSPFGFMHAIRLQGTMIHGAWLLLLAFTQEIQSQAVPSTRQELSKPPFASAQTDQASLPRDEMVTLNYGRADLVAIIHDLAEHLRFSYTIDPEVKGTVTLRSAGPIMREDLLPIFHQLLRTNGAVAVKTGEFYHIASNNEEEKGRVRSAGQGREDGNALQVVPVSFFPAAEMKRLLTPFIAPGGEILDYPPGSFLIIADLPSNIQRVIGIKALIDVQVFAGVRMEIYQPQLASAEELASKMTKIMRAEGCGADFLPLPRTNQLLVITRTESAWKHVKQRLEGIDSVGEGLRRRIFVYPVENGKVTELAKRLNGSRPPEKQRAFPDPATNSLVIFATPLEFREMKNIFGKNEDEEFKQRLAIAAGEIERREARGRNSGIFSP